MKSVSEPEDTNRKHGMSDLMLWSLGAAALLAAIYISCRFYFAPSFATAWWFLAGLCVLVPIVVAYKSQRAGLRRALLYIPLILAIPYIAREFGLYSVAGCWLRDPAGHGLEFSHFLRISAGHYSIAPPILFGAFAGWALRRYRSQR
jgi:hypothetical protein